MSSELASAISICDDISAEITEMDSSLSLFGGVKFCFLHFRILMTTSGSIRPRKILVVSISLYASLNLAFSLTGSCGDGEYQLVQEMKIQRRVASELCVSALRRF